MIITEDTISLELHPGLYCEEKVQLEIYTGRDEIRLDRIDPAEKGVVWSEGLRKMIDDYYDENRVLSVVLSYNEALKFGDE